jgi:hypothetical protein
LRVSGNASGETMVNPDNKISFIGTLRPVRQEFRRRGRVGVLMEPRDN